MLSRSATLAIICTLVLVASTYAHQRSRVSHRLSARVGVKKDCYDDTFWPRVYASSKQLAGKVKGVDRDNKVATLYQAYRAQRTKWEKMAEGLPKSNEQGKVGTAFKAFNDLNSAAKEFATFLKILQAEYKEENLMFLIQAQKFKDSPSTAQFDKVYNNFVKAGSPSEINLPAQMRTTLDNLATSNERGAAGTFTEAQAEIERMLRNSFQAPGNGGTIFEKFQAGAEGFEDLKGCTTPKPAKKN